MKFLLLSLSFFFLIFHTNAFSAESSQITHIKDVYKKASEKLANKDDPLTATSESQGPLWNILGIPRSRTLFYWESYRPDSRKPESDENTGIRLRKSVSYHGGVAADDHLINYIEFLFDDDGKVLFCYLKQGIGNISRIARCKWGKEERYYFHGDRLIRVAKGGKTDDHPDGKAVKRGREIVEHGKIIKIIAQNINPGTTLQIKCE